MNLEGQEKLRALLPEKGRGPFLVPVSIPCRSDSQLLSSRYQDFSDSKYIHSNSRIIFRKGVVPMAAPLKDRRRSLFVLASFILAFLMLTAFFGSPVWSQCTSCENCPPPVIGYTSRQMSTGGSQNLTASGGFGSYGWTFSGGGTLSGTEGTEVIYTAPSSNPDCADNPAITVTDSCGRVATLSLAVNAVLGSVSGYYASKTFADPAGYPVGWCAGRVLGVCYYGIAKRYLLCNNNLGSTEYSCSPGHNLYCTVDEYWLWGEDECAEEREECNISACPDGCAPGLHDTRTSSQLSEGCCPVALSACLNIDSFSADALTINLSGGERANFSGNISVDGGGGTSWTITVGGKVIPGSGNSISGYWDGTDSSGKQVAAGSYTAVLEAQATGNNCGQSVTSIPITVTARQANSDTPIGNLPSLKKCGDSAINVASGNLSHFQPLFTLPNSKFLGEFSLSYNSLSSQNDVLGMGWTHTYNIRLVANNDGSYTLTEGDGEKTVLYSKGSYFSPENSNYPALTISGTFTLQHKNGITYSFDQDKKITAISDRNSNAITFAYSTNTLTVTDPNGRNVVINYVNGKISTISDPSGNVHTFTYTGQDLTGVSSQIVNVGTANWVYTYYANSFMHTKTDPLNKTTTYIYDSDHRLYQATAPDDKNRYFVYTPAQSLTQMTEKDGGVWTYKYNAQLGVLTEVDYPDPYGPKEKYGYFQSGVNVGRLEYIEDQRGKRTYYAYDSGGNGNIASVTDALSHVTNYPIYNSLNQVKRIEYPGSPTPVVLLDYNAQGNLTYFKDPEGNETQFGYDSRGNLTTIQSIGNSLVNITNTYDPYNYLRTITDNRTGAVVQFEYDSAGNLTVHKDPMTPTNDIVFEYNGFNKVKKVTDPENNIIQFYYDLMANLASMTDANQKTTSYEYNYRGQVTKITDALNHITQFAYGTGCPSCGTGVEKLTSVTDARGKTTTFEYYLDGRLFKETDHLGKFKSYSYNIPLNKVTKTDEDGAIIQYTYDDLNRLTRIDYPDSTAATFGYDGRSNLTSTDNQNITYSPIVYDLNNRMTSIIDSNGKTISYQYNSLNQRTRMVADARTIDYSYDNGNRLYQVLSPGPVATITYDLAGRRQILSYPNLVTTDYTPNKAGFLTNLLTRYNQQTIINSFAYTPDGMGNRTNMTDLAGLHSYTYDNIYQLTQASHPNMPIEQFTYDPAGNRQTSEGQAPSLRSTEYTYDFENRLIEVDYFGTLAQYKYDPFGRRIEKNMNGAITRYLYDGPNIVTEYDGAWNVQAQYTQTLDIDDPLTVTQGANTYYYHRDGLGSVVNLTDSAGNVVKTYTYKSFGEIYSETGSLVQPFTFTGREFDPESGLYFYRARYYDPRAGRFLTKDPIGFDGGDVNLYRYVRNNPINLIDPSGLEADCIKEKKCIGRARILKGNPATIGKQGAFPSIKVIEGSAAVIPEQFGGMTKVQLAPYIGKISGTLGGKGSFSGITDVIGGKSPMPGINVRLALQMTYWGLLILELPSLANDPGIVDVELTIPADIPCPIGTMEKP